MQSLFTILLVILIKFSQSKRVIPHVLDPFFGIDDDTDSSSLGRTLILGAPLLGNAPDPFRDFNNEQTTASPLSNTQFKKKVTEGPSQGGIKLIDIFPISKKEGTVSQTSKPQDIIDPGQHEDHHTSSDVVYPINNDHWHEPKSTCQCSCSCPCLNYPTKTDEKHSQSAHIDEFPEEDDDYLENNSGKTDYEMAAEDPEEPFKLYDTPIKMDSYIIDGIGAHREELPSAVMVTRKYFQNGATMYRCYCSATLIHPSWTVTAGHCIYDKFEPSCIFGSTMLIGDSYYDESAIVRDISRKNVFVHPDYTLEGLSNDIALFKHDAVPFSRHIRPASLPINEYEDYTNNAILVAGYGVTKLTDNRQIVTLSYVDTHASNSHMCKVRHGKEKFCALIVSKDGKRPAACFGDSGGGCYKKPRKGRAVTELIGVNSAVANSDCSGANTFVRLSNYHSWINSVTGL